MFVLRSASLDDLEDLYELSGKVFFINLPHDKKVIQDKLEQSIQSFMDPSQDLSENYYFFVLEDLKENKVIGVSMIHAQHGTPKEPHFFLKVSSEHKFSQTINTGFVHGTLKLGLETDGPTEIGGLVVSPEYRGNPSKLGKQISFVRFLYMAIHPERFKQEVHSELMPPLDENGDSPLWEAIGRRFLNMNYADADRLSRSNKEFILSLFPSENIYMTLLPYEARNAIGEVGKDTMPVKKMLETIGFEYTGEVDPFDGGPHYRCNLAEIKPVKNHFKRPLKINKDGFPLVKKYLIQFKQKNFPFFAIMTEASFDAQAVYLPEKVVSKFNLSEGETIVGIPF